MSGVAWVGGSGDWNTGSLWSDDTVPNGTTAEVAIAAGGTYAVTIGSGESFTADTVTLDNAFATLDLDAGAILALDGAASLMLLEAGFLEVAGTLAGGTIDLAGGAIAAAGGTLLGVTVEGSLDLSAYGSSLTIADGLTVVNPVTGTPGEILLAAGGLLTFADAETLADVVVQFNGGELIFDDTLVVADTSTIDVAADYGTEEISFSGFSPAVFDNAGLIELQGTGDALTAYLDTIVNSGTITVGYADSLKLFASGPPTAPASFINSGEIAVASGGSFYLYFYGSIAPVIGTVDVAAGGFFELSGYENTLAAGSLDAIDNTGGTVALQAEYSNAGQLLTIGGPGSLDNLELYYGGDIVGGTIAIAGGSLTFAHGTLDGVTWADPTFVVGTLQVVEIAHGITFEQPVGVTIDGAIQELHGETLAFGASTPVLNDGLLEAEGGSLLQIGGTLQGFGVIDIGQNSTVVLAGADATESVSFFDIYAQANDTGTLVIQGSFDGVIGGFGNSNGYAIDFANVAASSFAFDATDGILSLFDAGGALVGTLTFAEPGLTTASFHIESDGAGGTLVTRPPIRTWNGGDGDWYNTGSWTTTGPFPASFPLPGDTVSINAGAVTITAADVGTYGTLHDETVYVAVGATLAATDETFGEGVTLTLDGSLVLAGPSTLAGTLFSFGVLTDTDTLTNTGTIVTYGTVATGTPTLVNDGLIDVDEQATLTSAVFGTGQISLGYKDTESAAALTVGAGVVVGASQVVDFVNGYDKVLTLDLAHPDDFAAELVGFVKGDTIVLQGLVASSETYDATSGTIDIYGSAGGSLVAALDIGAGFLADNFNLTTSGESTYLTTNRVTSDGADVALQGAQARAEYGVDGTGITIGIISDSFNLHGGEAADIASGDLPANVNILQDGSSSYYDNDEGRAMAELIHRIAPGATIDFYASGDSDASFATAVTQLAAAGANIIVDDLVYPDEPFFETGSPEEVAIANALATGTVDYFSAIGNEGQAAFQSAFTPITTTLPGFAGPVEANDFGGGNPLQALTFAYDEPVDLELQWDQPFASIGGSAGAQNSLSMYLFNDAGMLVASGTQSAIDSDPIQSLYFDNTSQSTAFYLAIVWDQGSTAPGLFKYVDLENGYSGLTIDNPNADDTGVGFGHNVMAGVNSVGAADYADTPDLGLSPGATETFSDDGPSEILFDSDGDRLATPETLDAPTFISVDGPATDVFDPFHGTSAAAPDAAAVAALMLEANPNLTQAQVTAFLDESAISLDEPTDEQGAGLIQANVAVGLAVAAACYLAGTRIATPAGERPIEALRIGDEILTAGGEVLPVRWIGRRSYSGRFVAGNRHVLPVLFRAGALADGVPRRDLLVSPRHAMLLDGVLIPAERLVNGVSVVQIDQVDRVDYRHLELDRHDVLLADGAPSESFVDCDSRMMFQNAHEFRALYPAGLGPSHASCAERVVSGPALEAARRRIARRAGLDRVHADDTPAPGVADGRLDVVEHGLVTGWAFDPARPHAAIEVEILVDGALAARIIANLPRDDLARAGKGRGWCAFTHRFARPLPTRVAHRVEVRIAGGSSIGERMLDALDGRIDTCNPLLVEGWAIDCDRQDRSVRLEVLRDGVVIGLVLADQYRPDLAAAGLGSGRCAYRFDLTPWDAGASEITLRRATDGAMLASARAAGERRAA